MMNRIILILLIFIPANYLAGQLDQSKALFVEDVIFVTEYSSKPSRHCKRWVKPPKLSIFGNGNSHQNLLENVVAQLNNCLPNDLQIELLEPESEAATIKLYFDAYDELGRIAEDNGCQYTDGNLGFFFCWWNSKFEIRKAVILIAEDKLSGYRLNHFVLEELTQTLGFPGDSKHRPKSVFYEDKSVRKFGKATSLSEDDRDLITFHYGYNLPGQGPVQVGINLSKFFADQNENKKRDGNAEK